MATDYDAPRRTETEDLNEDSLEELKARRSEAQSSAVDVDETDAVETGEINLFVGPRFVVTVRHGEGYCLAFFLVGAYQEILGDIHNLFGDTNAVNVVLDEAAPEGFPARYFEMLKAGGSKHHGELLAPFGLDAADPAFWDKGLSMIEAMIDELEAMEA